MVFSLQCIEDARWPVFIKAVLLLTFIALCGCTNPSDKACTRTDHCFKDEICVDGTCVIAIDNSNNDVDTDDCILNLGICGSRYCHPTLRQCVDCVRNDHCGPNFTCDSGQNRCICVEGTHLCGDSCVADDAPAHCGSRCEPCPGADGAIATCVEGQCGLECMPGFEECSGAECGSPCVRECESSVDCIDPAHPRCDSGRCQGCESPEDCADRPQTRVCHIPTGACVQCSVDDPTACEDRSCDPVTRECTDTVVRSLDVCMACRADIECPSSQRCVPMYYREQPRQGGYCLNVKRAGEPCGIGLIVAVERVSLSGHPLSTYCSIDEDMITCEAYRSYGVPCQDSSECGASDREDALCVLLTTGGSPICTYACNAHEHCVIGAYCEANDGRLKFCQPEP